MATDKPYQEAKRIIARALRTGVTKLDLSCRFGAKDSEKLTELPESLGELTQLLSLNLSGNQLTELPESLGELTQLLSLNLSGNQLTELPESLGAPPTISSAASRPAIPCLLTCHRMARALKTLMHSFQRLTAMAALPTKPRIVGRAPGALSAR